MRKNGFTLIELIVVIVLMGIISGLTSLIIGNTFQAYTDLARREALQSSTRLAIERITREVRHALPNSVCTFNGIKCNEPANQLYFMKTVDGGRYQDQAGDYSPDQPRIPLPIGLNNSNDQFEVISGKVLNVSVGQWVVVNSLDMSVYSDTSNRKQKINQILTMDTDGDPATPEINVIQFATSVFFPQHSPYGRRFHVVEENAVLFYISGGNLRRAESLFGSSTTPIAGTDNLLLENVAAGSFTYIPGVQQRTGLLRINLTVTAEGESINIVHEVHVRNVP